MCAVETHLPLPRVRAMRPADVRFVADIEAQAYDFPWSPGIFSDCLAAGYGALVLELPRAGIHGYAMLSTAVAEAHLLNLCVRPTHQGAGLGRFLLEAVLEHARAAGSEQLYLEVRPSNEAALALYRNAGFAEIGRRRRYYRARSGREDALVLSKCLRETPGP